MITEFFKLPKIRLVFWLIACLLIASLVLFNIIDYQFIKYENLTDIFTIVLSFTISTILVLVSVLTGILKVKKYSIQSFIYTWLFIVSIGIFFTVLGVNTNKILENYLIALLFPLNLGLFYFLKKEE